MEIKDLKYAQTFVQGELDDSAMDNVEALCDDYRAFLDAGKTERECVKEAIALCEKNGFVPFDNTKPLKKGDKVYVINRNKNILLAVIGSKPITDGVNMVGAHIDSPRLDLKQNPLYESCNMSLLKTHYYGGIKKYQWTTIPLAIHGVVFKADGSQVDIKIGEDEADPVFCVTDLLPHLGKDQMSKKMSEGVEGEALNILFGGYKFKDEEKDAFKANILKLLNQKYGMVEEDFLSCEIEVVPAFKARNVGLDGAFVGAYGQDDRVCAYTALRGILDIDSPVKTAICLLVDKEEIGSCGNTGMLSDFYRMTLAELVKAQSGKCDLIDLNNAVRNSACMSSDVGAAVDPNYESVSEKQNASFAGNGMVLMKYTGARGKSGSNDANAEFISKLRIILNSANVIWQTGELGKVDQGGGGTIAQYVANLNMDVIDCGVPVLSMHSPYEVTAKTDVYMAYKTYVAFYKLYV